MRLSASHGSGSREGGRPMKDAGVGRGEGGRQGFREGVREADTRGRGRKQRGS